MTSHAHDPPLSVSAVPGPQPLPLTLCILYSHVTLLLCQRRAMETRDLRLIRHIRNFALPGTPISPIPSHPTQSSPIFPHLVVHCYVACLSNSSVPSIICTMPMN